MPSFVNSLLGRHAPIARQKTIVAHRLFPVFASLWLAALLGLGTLAISGETLFVAITKLGVAVFLPISAPISLSTHFVLAVALALIGAAIGFAGTMHFRSSYGVVPVEAANEFGVNGFSGCPAAQVVPRVNAPIFDLAGPVQAQQLDQTASGDLPLLDQTSLSESMATTDDISQSAQKPEPLAMTMAVTELTWARLLVAAKVVRNHCADSLRQAGLPSPEWYEVLAALERHGPLRPRALQSKLEVEQYTLSPMIDRMVHAGLVNRRTCIEDGRGHMLDLTNEGRTAYTEMQPIYYKSLEAWFGDRITLKDRIVLGILLGTLAKSIGD